MSSSNTGNAGGRSPLLDAQADPDADYQRAHSTVRVSSISFSAVSPPPPHRCLLSSTVIIGLVSVLVQVVTNQAIGELLQYQEKHTSFDQPLLTIWLNHAFLSLNLVLAWAITWWREGREARSKNGGGSGGGSGGGGSGDGSSCPRPPSPCAPIKNMMRRHGWSYRQLALRATWLTLIYMIPNVAWASVVKHVSVTLSVGTQQGSIVFVFLFSVVWMKSRVRTAAVLATLICSGGVVLFCYGQDHAPPGANVTNSTANGTNSGRSIVTPSAISAVDFILLGIFPVTIAIFDVALKSYSKGFDRLEDIATLIGTLGLANALVLWVLLPLASVCGLEVFALPQGGLATGLFFASAVLATVFNFAFMGGIALTNPLFMAVGGMLQLPVSTVTDMIIHELHINPASLVGGGCILVGFIVLVWSEETEGGGQQSEGAGATGGGKGGHTDEGEHHGRGSWGGDKEDDATLLIKRTTLEGGSQYGAVAGADLAGEPSSAVDDAMQ